ncbi:hypothetical protein [Brevifollis gellanilyticus]|uniref:Uncharacterized protein n=1 Tax=Brevifollis gellanilyticus TaxID=748831 RepID=A0A512M8C2_9BACT|nr:hypothetical protein [Brevifollis gellanilyticus]GEP42986.1 hypothetical protein BGE01nite_22770 [Brevifollis gellanilyticus]
MNSTTLWLHTTAAIAVAAGALWLHLRWHPRRQEFSESWDLVTGLPWLTVLHGMLLVAGQLMGAPWITGSMQAFDLGTWLDIAGPLFLGSLMENVSLQHSLLPAWPWALFLPVVLALLSWRVIRYPYRYGPRQQRPAEKWLLAGGMVISWAWLVLEMLTLGHKVMPEWLEGLRVAMRVIFQAVTMAFTQVVLARLVIAWMEPEQPDDQKDLGLAIEHTFARWRGVAGLAVLDLLILLLQGTVTSGRGLLFWVLMEVMVLFLLFPVAVARVPGTWLGQGMAALLAWKRAWASILGVLLSGVFILAIVRYASVTMLEVTGEGTWRTLLLLPVHGLVLATVRNWVFLALVLTLLHHGLIPSSRRGRAVS